MADNKTSIIISAVDQTGAALKSAEAGLAGLGAQAGKLSGVLSGFAALAGVTAFGGIIKGAIDAADELDDLAQKSGATVESLSAMKGVAKIAGADMEQVAGGLAKLSKNMVEAANGSGDAAKVLAALGVSVTDNAGKMKSTDQVMVEFAKSLQNVGSGTEKVAAAQLVLGKSGAQLLPFLNDLAAAGDLQVKVTAEQAAAAANLNDNIKRLSVVHKSWANTVAMEVVPVADVFVKALLETAQAANGTKKAVEDMAADGTLKEWAISAAKSLGFIIDEMQLIGKIAIEIATPIERLGKNLMNVVSLGTIAVSRASLSEKADAYKQLEEESKKFYASLDARLASNRADNPLFSDVLAKRISEIGTASQAAAPGVKSIAAALGDAGDKAAKAAQAMADLRMETLVNNAKAAAKELETIAKAQEEYSKALYAGSDALEAQAAALEREVRYYGMTESAIQNTIIARLQEARAIAAANGAYPEHLAFLDREIEARQRIATASSQKDLLETNKRAAEQTAKDWEKLGDDINRSLTDALMRGFENGKSFGDNFVDSLKASLKTLVIRVVVNMATNATGSLVASAADALLGTRFSASTPGATGSTGNLLGAANNLSTAYNAGSYLTAAGAAYAQYQAGIPVSQWALSTYAPVTTATSTTGAAANGMAGSAGSTGAASTVAWVAAIVAGMWMSSQAWKAGIRWENYAAQDDVKYWDAEVGLRAMKDKPMAALFGKDFVNSEFYAVMSGSALSAQIHYAIQGALFGKTRVTGSQINGTFSEAEQGFSGMQGVNYKRSGSLFRSSKEWTEWSALPAEVDNAMDMIYRGVRNSFIMLGEVFEDTSLAQKLQGFVYSFTVGELSIDSVTNGLTQTMSARLTPAINAAAKAGESFQQTFQRVINETNATQRAFEVMGRSLVATFGQNNLNGILAASDAFIQLFGSVDAFNQSFDAYFQNYFTAQEKTARGWSDMIVAFDQIGVAMPTSRAAFRALVDSLDLSTTQGRATFKSLMDLQGAFAALTPTIEEATAAAQALGKAAQEMQAQQIGAYYAAQRKAQEDAIKLQITQATTAAATAQDLIDSFKAISENLGAYRDTLRQGAGSGGDRYDLARATYQTTAAQALLGNIDAANNLQGVAETFLQASREVGTASTYARDVATVIATVDNVVGVADRQIPIAEQQLAAATAQTELLQGILKALEGNTTPPLVANYQQAASDFAAFFASTNIGQTLAVAGGTMQRISDSMGLFVDAAGQGATFGVNDTPYTLAAASAAYRQYLLQKYGAWTGPSFAGGGYHSGGLRLVGENGPELEFTGPSRILNATDTAALLANGGLAQAVSDLAGEVAGLRAEVQSVAVHTFESAKTLKVMRGDGIVVRTEVGAPLETIAA